MFARSFRLIGSLVRFPHANPAVPIFLADWLLALLRFCHLDVGMWLCWEGEQRFYQLFDCLGRSRRAANRLPMQVSELRLITSLLAASRAGIPQTHTM